MSSSSATASKARASGSTATARFGGRASDTDRVHAAVPAEDAVAERAARSRMGIAAARAEALREDVLDAHAVPQGAAADRREAVGADGLCAGEAARLRR